MNAKNYVQRSGAIFTAALIFLAGCEKKQETPSSTPVTQAAKPALVSAEKNSFTEVTSKLDPGGSFYLYLSTEQIVNGLSNHLSAASNFISALPNFPGTERQNLDRVFTILGGVVADSGINQISGLGMSSIAREKGFHYNKVIIHHYPGQTNGLVWSLFGQSPHPLKVLDFLPETTALASSSDFDLQLAWTNIVQVVRMLDLPEPRKALDQIPAKFHEMAGLDLDATLKSLAGEFGMILTLDLHKTVTLPLGDKPIVIPNPGLCLIFKVNSDLIFDRVDQLLNSNKFISQMLVKTDEPGLKMRTVLVPLPLPIEVHPSLARVGDYLLLSSSDNMVREMVAVQSGQKKGFKSTDAFKRLSQGVPSEGNNFSLVTTAFASAVAKIQQSALAGQNMDPEALKSFGELMQKGTNYGAYSVGRNGPEGWEGVGNGGSQGMQMMVAPAVAMGGVLSAIAFPNLVTPLSSAPQNAFITNLRVIDAAKEARAIENRKKTTDTPTMEDLPAILAGINELPPGCPAGGVSTIGPASHGPMSSIAKHVLP